MAGWHFNLAVFAQLRQVPGADVYVVSHRPAASVPEDLFGHVNRSHVFFEPNIGYDWGCYQQFLDKQLWQRYDLLFFLHDDVTIRSLDFIPNTVQLLGSGATVVGNGRNSPRRAWGKTQPWYYAHSRWLPPSLGYEHETVRGSFLATTRSVLERLGRLEVFWDPLHISDQFGNYSLIATGGKLQHIFGDRCFAFLGETYLESPYISEEVRGGRGQRGRPQVLTHKAEILLPPYIKLAKMRAVQRICPRPENPIQTFAGRTVDRFLSVISGARPWALEPRFERQ